MLIVRKNFSKTEEKEKKGKKTGIKIGGGTIALGAAAVGAEKAANKLGEKAGEIVTGQAKGNGKFVKLSGTEKKIQKFVAEHGQTKNVKELAKKAKNAKVLQNGVKSTIEMAKKNPKAAAGVVAGSMALAGVRQAAIARKKNKENQKEYSEYQAGVTKYDRTDRIKAMKDADILAEKKRSNTRSYVGAAKTGVAGASVGGAIGAIAGAATKLKKGDIVGAKKAAVTGAKAGAAIGGVVAGGTKLAATHNQREQNRFVNRRLAEAKTQAVRREAKDWKNNATGREGYTY